MRTYTNKKSIFGLLLSILTLFLCVTILPERTYATELVDLPVTVNVDYDMSYAYIDEVNKIRQSEGYETLIIDSSLMEIAFTRACETMLYDTHYRPSTLPFDALEATENIANMNPASLSTAIYGLKNSSSHYAVAISPYYKSTGVCIVDIGGTSYLVQVFGTNDGDGKKTGTGKNTRSTNIQVHPNFIVPYKSNKGIYADASGYNSSTKSYFYNQTYTLDYKKNVTEVEPIRLAHLATVPSIITHGYTAPANILSRFTYESSDTSIFTVNTAGNITIKKPGSAYLIIHNGWDGYDYYQPVTINATPITNFITTTTMASEKYTGTPIQKVINISGLTLGEDYTVSYSNNTNPGKASITITGIGNFTGSQTITFDIIADLPAISTDIPDQTYTGDVIRPTVSINGLTEGTDYTLSYEYAIVPGTYKVTATGIGYYTGTQTKSYTILEPSATPTTPSGGNTGTNTGGSSTGGQGNGSTGNTSSGSTSSGTNSGGTTITKKALTDADIYVFFGTIGTTTKSCSYTGKAVCPTMIVTQFYNGNYYNLTNNSDYTITYSNNINPGTATATITGIGNYTGTRNADFTIVKTSTSNPETNSSGNNTQGSDTQPKPVVTSKNFTVKLSATSYAYNASEHRPAVTVYDGSKKLSSSYYTVTYSNNKNVGTASVTVKGKGSYSGYTGNATFQIKANVFKVKVRTTSYTYNGKTKKPKVYVYVNGKKISSKYYKVSYSNTKNVGVGTVKVTGKSKYKYYTGHGTFNIKLKKQTVSYNKSKKKQQLLIKWKMDSQSQGYQVQYSTNKKFKSGVKTITVKSKSSTSVTIKNLTSKKNYYVRVRSYKKVNGKYWYGSWSSTKKAKIK